MRLTKRKVIYPDCDNQKNLTKIDCIEIKDKQQAEEKGLAKDVEFYLQFFKYGCPPHGGFGLGIDRITMNMLELANIKESMFLFRGPDRLTP